MVGQYQWLVEYLVGRLDTVRGQKSVEVTFAGDHLVQRRYLRVLRLREFQRPGLPIVPAVSAGQIAMQLARQIVGILPASQAQQQAQAPLGDGVVAQFRVVLGHQVQSARVIAACQGQADFARDRDLLVAREVHRTGVVVEFSHGLVRVLLDQAAQAQADHIRHGLVSGRKQTRLAEQFGFLRHAKQQLALWR